MSSPSLYDHDFHAWANEQADLLRAGKLGEADILHIAEEIGSMGKTEKRELVSRLTVLLLHLLKWQFQPAFRGHSWRTSVRVQRIALVSHMRDNPSLNAALDDAITEAYRVARIEAEDQTGLAEDTFPAACFWSFDQIMAEDFWPDLAPG